MKTLFLKATFLILFLVLIFASGCGRTIRSETAGAITNAAETAKAMDDNWKHMANKIKAKDAKDAAAVEAYKVVHGKNLKSFAGGLNQLDEAVNGNE